MDNSGGGLQEWSAFMFSGEHVRFRELRDPDLAHLSEWWNDPSQAILQQERVTARPLETTAAMFRTWSKNESPSGFGYSIVNPAEKLVGHISVWGMSVPERIATMAIIIGPEFQDQGLGRESLQLGLRIVFEEMGAHKAELQTWSYNQRAIHLYRSLGFREEGRRRAAAFHRGEFHDQVLLGMLEEEYREAG
ncbi:GNAT family N-acetyltransferase [Arthrobacter yangruifuii]|uniref:GNAT family N-acetyltransferase n=1 Tax=Arthrobacter yangruifuii TaxID=2606616 RepID=A0A5N6MF87_9MICC|nr:GNAT family protein [Arthrobacter yangruifuii]KAD3514964.1 GNAT family N-acetyltransferase [Arthrobacter yangruifuii]